MSTLLTFTDSITENITNVVNANGTGDVTIYTCTNPTGARIYAIAVMSNDTVPHDVQIKINNGTTTFRMGTTTTVANAGNTNALITDDLFADAQLNAMFSKNIDANGVPYWNIPNGWSVVIALPVVVTAGREMNFFVYGEEY
jgi:hypothetical protein